MNFMVSRDNQRKLEQDIAAILQQAHEMGVTIGQSMVDVQESAIGDVAKSFVDKARDIVSGIIDRVREMISNALESGEEDADPEQLAQDAVGSAIDLLPELIAETEIPTVIEDAVMGVMRSNGVARIVWVVSPGACELCMENAEYGPVDMAGSFPNGDRAPLHPRCRCVVMPAGSE